jgi:putative glutamine amidotransferase
MFPPGETHRQRLLDLVDGLILAGGGDMDPALYGGSPHETIYMVDPERDASELGLARQVIESGMPTLGICRGAQMINVALGGTLHEHLPDVVGEKVAHRAPPRVPSPHAVTVRAGTRLATIVDRLEFEAASWHHQAVRELAPRLVVAAHAPDGTIEGVEMPDHPWLVAVQWHPELTAATDATQQRIFDAFVEAVARRPGRSAARVEP